MSLIERKSKDDCCFQLAMDKYVKNAGKRIKITVETKKGIVSMLS